MPPGRRRARRRQNLADPDSGSNEAGLGPWGPAALPHVEGRIREAIEGWGVRYFKFDFLVWLDCLGGPDGVRDMYEFHDAFVAMLDRLRADHPDVTFQIDETNDYRLFPFESVTRGPTWFQNGGPDVDAHAAQPVEPEPVRPDVLARARTRSRTRTSRASRSTR